MDNQRYEAALSWVAREKMENPVIKLFTTIGEALLFAGVLAVLLFAAVALGM